jgi:hypothetical protein
MQWSCPHCGTRLGLSDIQINHGWSFSQCYKCAGFALIRKAEINVIKVDKAPPGEKVLLPDANETPRIAVLGEQAVKRLGEHLSDSQQPILSSLDVLSKPDLPPSPLLELQEMVAIPKGKKLNNALLALLIASCSGFYLFMEFQDTWKSPKKKRARLTVKQNTTASEPKEYLFKATSKTKQPEFRSGPGLQYPVLPTTDSTNEYLVLEWQNSWYKMVSAGNNQSLGWIPSDQVKTEPF